MERDLPQLYQLLERQLQAVRKQLPAPSIAIERAEISSLKRDLEHFLKLESSPENQRVPVGLEVPFGMGEDGDEPLASLEPIWIDLADGLRFPLRGRIDRIDRVKDGYAVVDYKTGKKLHAGKAALYERGQLLQHALYALVTDQLLKRHSISGRVVETSYYFPTVTASKSWTHFAPPEPKQLGRVLEAVLEPLRNGAFIHTHKPEQDCAFCEFKSACQAHLGPIDSPQANPAGVAPGPAVKLANPNNKMLELRRLLLEEA